MGDDCCGCREWEEHMYWSHFQSVHFFLILPSSYDQQAIPQKFVNNLRNKLAGAISLRGPGGALWNVEVTAGGAGDTLFFKQGWKAFVEDHSLEENDVLIFKYTGDSRFDVLVFDKESLCEKEASYFVRRCTDVGSGCKRKKETFPESFEVTKESSHDATNGDDVPLKRHGIAAAKTSKPVGQRPKAGSSKRTTTPYKLELSSNRRPVTIQEKEKALQMAHAASSEDSFMSIPFEWLKKYLPQKSRNLILRCSEREWSVTFQRRFHNNGGLTVGWRKFVLDNCLEESDVCLFKPSGKTTEAMVFKVSIFRVVEDQVIPPCPANPLIPSKGRARSLAVHFSNRRAKMN